MNRRDFDALLSFYAAAVVVSQRELPSLEGAAAIQSFIEDWTSPYEELRFEPEEILELGNGVTLAVVRQNARQAGSTAHLVQREGRVVVWEDGLIVRHTTYRDIDEARESARRLADSRG